MRIPELPGFSARFLGPVLGMGMLWALVQMCQPWSSGPIYTADDYLYLGDQLVHRFQTSMASWHLPLYVVLRGLMNIGGIHESWFNSFCVVGIYALMLAAGSLIGGMPAALLAGAGFLAIYPGYSFDFHDVQHFYCVLTLIAAGLLACRSKEPSYRASLLLALSLGVSLLCRSTMVFLPFAIVAFDWVSGRQQREALRKHAAILLIVPYLFLLPWIWMNWRLHRQFIPLEYGQADGNIVPGALGVVGTPEGCWPALVGRPLAHNEVLGWAVKETLWHPLRYLAGCARRAALVISWGRVLFVLASLGLWRGRSRREILALAVLAGYFAAIYCFMSIQPQYFKPLWLLLCLLAACGPSAWMSDHDKAGPPIGSVLAIGTIKLFLAASLALAGYVLFLVGTYPDKAVPISTASLDNALKEHPRDPWLWYQRGLNRLRDRSAGAGDDFRRAVDLDPVESRFWLALEVVEGRWSGPPPTHPHDIGDMLLVRAEAELRKGERMSAQQSLRAAMAAYESALYLRGRPSGRDAEVLRPMHAAFSNFLHGAYEVLVLTIRPEDALALLHEIEKISPADPAVLEEEARLAGLAGPAASR